MSDKKCMACGEELNGPAFYCEGCGGYLSYTCGIPNDDKFRCPNCGSDLQFTTL